MKFYNIEKIFIHSDNDYNLGALTENQMKKQIKGFTLFQQLDNKTKVYKRKKCKYFYIVTEL